MKPTISRIVLILSICIQCSLSWPKRITEDSVCSSFHVSHSSSGKVAASSVSVTLMKQAGGSIVNCIDRDTVYLVEFRKSGQNLDKIKGILILLVNHTVNPATDPPGEILIEGYLPVNTIDGICGKNSLSHSCRTDSGCKLGDNGEWLNITYMSSFKPWFKESIQNVSFRYTIVLSNRKYIENETVTFPVCQTTNKKDKCSLEAHETNLAGDTVKYCPNFDLKPGANESVQNCGKIQTVKSNESHIFTSSKSNINYTCHTTMTVKKTDCHPTCTRDGQELCCRNRIAKMRPRNFTCTAVPELNTGEIAKEDETITRRADVLQTKQCVCYLCADIICSGCSKKEYF